MATPKKNKQAADTFKSALHECCYDHVRAHQASDAKMAINVGGLITKIEAMAEAALPGVLSGLSVAENFTPAQYKPLIDALITAATEAENLLGQTPATPATA